MLFCPPLYIKLYFIYPECHLHNTMSVFLHSLKYVSGYDITAITLEWKPCICQMSIVNEFEMQPCFQTGCFWVPLMRFWKVLIKQSCPRITSTHRRPQNHLIYWILFLFLQWLLKCHYFYSCRGKWTICASSGWALKEIAHINRWLLVYVLIKIKADIIIPICHTWNVAIRVFYC